MTKLMVGKTVLVTGATNGIGLAAARELARMGAQTILVSRSAEKCELVCSQIKKETGNPHVEFVVADLSIKAGVEHVADEFLKRHTRLDVLLNNAGAIFMSRQVSADGIEMTLALNHLNYFYLTSLLLDILKTSQPARVINVSSDAHRGGKIKFDDIQLQQGYAGFGAYSQSKLANLLFTYELARRLEGTKITVNALHPGFVDTGFGKNNSSVFKFVLGLLRPIQKKVDDGACTSIFLASSHEVENISGKYFIDSKVAESDSISYDLTAAQKLWQISLKLLS